MAKLGEGDPRWIVREREDGVNVNNWHWVQKDCTAWAKTRITELLSNLVLYSDKHVKARISTVESVSGEATANNRKGKRIVFYELNVKAKWSGELIASSGDESSAEGTLEVTNLSEENDADDLEVQVSTSGTGSSSDKIKEVVRKAGASVIRQQLATFIAEIRTGSGGASDGCSSPPPAPSVQRTTSSPAPAPSPLPVQSSKATAAPGQPNKTAIAAAASSSARRQADASPMPKPDFTKITQKVTFCCPPMELFECLVNPQRVQAYTQAPAVVSKDLGASFSLFNGTITGSNLEIIPGKKLVQTWRFNDWPADIYSTVTIELEPDSSDGNLTKLTLTQTGVPDVDVNGHGGVVERTTQGWKMHFWERIKMVFGYGTNMPF